MHYLFSFLIDTVSAIGSARKRPKLEPLKTTEAPRPTSLPKTEHLGPTEHGLENYNTCGFFSEEFFSHVVGCFFTRGNGLHQQVQFSARSDGCNGC